MERRTYIYVILPLKLEWEPCYVLPEGMSVCVGDRVKAPCAGKTYNGVVSAVGIEPTIEEIRIKEIISVESGLEKIREEEIALWR